MSIGNASKYCWGLIKGKVTDKETCLFEFHSYCCVFDCEVAVLSFLLLMLLRNEATISLCLTDTKCAFHNLSEAGLITLPHKAHSRSPLVVYLAIGESILGSAVSL